MRPTPYVASLRIYEPFEYYDRRLQKLWPTDFSNLQTTYQEQKESLCKTVTLNYLSSKIEGAYYLEVDNIKYVAPWSTTIRINNSFYTFVNSFPSNIVDYFIPREINNSIQSTLQNIESKISHILTSTWSIPPRWFALFSPGEGNWGMDHHGYFSILRTTISNAKQRCRFAYQTVISAFGEGLVASEISDLLSWLEIFDPNSIVELDYGGLATFLHNSLLTYGDPGLEADSSVEDVNSSLAGLASGDGVLAGKGYERLVIRWRRVAAFESAS